MQLCTKFEVYSFTNFGDTRADPDTVAPDSTRHGNKMAPTGLSIGLIRGTTWFTLWILINSNAMNIQISLVGSQYILLLTLISYTPLRYIRNVAREE